MNCLHTNLPQLYLVHHKTHMHYTLTVPGFSIKMLATITYAVTHPYNNPVIYRQ